MNYYIAGAGGFIGGHLVNRLVKNGNKVIAVDVKQKNEWFQINNKAKNFFECDLKVLKNCEDTIHNEIDVIINLACNMGGIGFITSYKAECMLSVLINTNLLMQAKEKKIKNFFFSSSACIYPTHIQSDEKSVALKEHTAYPANFESLAIVDSISLTNAARRAGASAYFLSAKSVVAKKLNSFALAWNGVLMVSWTESPGSKSPSKVISWLL